MEKIINLEEEYNEKFKIEDFVEFVIFDDSGKEVDWINPVYEMKITEDKIYINNTLYIYVYSKKEGGIFPSRGKKELCNKVVLRNLIPQEGDDTIQESLEALIKDEDSWYEGKKEYKIEREIDSKDNDLIKIYIGE